MKVLYRKVLRRLGVYRKYKTEKIGRFLVTYEPATDIGGQLFRRGGFETEEIDLACEYIDSDSVVLDIGANIGIHTLNFANKAKDGLVIAFEPQPKTFSTLKKNLSQNDISNVIPLQLAISDTAKIAKFYVAVDDAYSSLVNTRRKEISQEVQVFCSTVDGLVGDVDVGFVKIDVEGLELSVLHSMSGVIRRCHPVIFCEIYKGNLDSYNPHDTIGYLTGMGYVAKRMVGRELLDFCSDSKHDDRYYNYFFIPKR